MPPIAFEWLTLLRGPRQAIAEIVDGHFWKDETNAHRENDDRRHRAIGGCFAEERRCHLQTATRRNDELRLQRTATAPITPREAPRKTAARIDLNSIGPANG